MKPISDEDAIKLALPIANPKWLIIAEGRKPTDKDLWAAYIDRTEVQDRLDSVMGTGNWSFEVEPIPGTQCVRGRLAVGGVIKEDIGDGTGATAEPLKAAVSDALKRCATHFGIGRHLPERQYLPKGQRPTRASGPPQSVQQPAKRTPAKPKKAEPVEDVPFEPDNEVTYYERLADVQREQHLTIDDIMELCRIEWYVPGDAPASFRKYVATIAAQKSLSTEGVYKLIYEQLIKALPEGSD